MKVKNTPLAALTCAALLGSAALSPADVLVSENFDSYGDGPLNGAGEVSPGVFNGGFSNAWSSSVNVGGGVVGGNDASTRSFTAHTFGSSGTLWVSFDWGFDSKPTENGSYGGLTFYAGGSERFLIGNTWPGTGHDVWRMSNGGTTSVLDYGMKTGVAKITLGAGGTSTVELWVGPTGSPVYVGGAPLATVTSANLEGVDGIRIMGQDFGGVNSAFDNLLIGETMADVDATDTVPTYAWTGATDNNFTESANWVENAWTQWSDYTFGGTPDRTSVTIDAYVGIDSLTLQSGLEQDIVINSTTEKPVIMGVGVSNGNPLALITIAADSSNLTINGDYIAASAVTWDVGAERTLTLNGPLNTWFNTASLIKNGDGTAVLTGANGYTGVTTVNDGTLQVSGQPYFNVGRTTTVALGAVLELSNSNNTFTSLMPPSTVTGAGTFRLAGNSTINQDTNGSNELGNRLTFAMTGGWIDLLDTSRLTNGGWQELNWTDNKASMNLASEATLDLWDGQNVFVDALTGAGSVVGGAAASGLHVGVNDGSGTFSGSINIAASLIKQGTGTQTLSGANTSGATTVSNGTLVISGQSYFNVGRTTTVASGAVLELSNSNNTFTSLMPVSTVTGAGTFRLSGNSTINQDTDGTVGTRLTFAMDADGWIDLQDTSRLTNGGWQELNWTDNKASMNLASGATLDVWDGQDVILDALTGSGTVDKTHSGNSPRLLKVGVDNGSGTFSGTITNTGGQLAFTKVGSGTQTLSGTISYSGNTTVEDGTLSVANPNFADTSTLTIGSAPASPAVLHLPNAGTDTVAVLIIDGETKTGNGTVYDSTNSGGAITGSGKIQVGTAPADPFLAWINATWPTLSDKTPGGDPDNDGMKNLLEYVLKDGDPSASSTGILPTLNTSGTDFVFTYYRRAAATGTTQTFQYGSDLGATPWTDVAVEENPGPGVTVAITSPEAGIEQIVITVPKDTDTKLFGRLQVTQP